MFAYFSLSCLGPTKLLESFQSCLLLIHLLFLSTLSCTNLSSLLGAPKTCMYTSEIVPQVHEVLISFFSRFSLLFDWVTYIDLDIELKVSSFLSIPFCNCAHLVNILLQLLQFSVHTYQFDFSPQSETCFIFT